MLDANAKAKAFNQNVSIASNVENVFGSGFVCSIYKSNNRLDRKWTMVIQ